MSHVDDGELTAYADGAYPADDPVALRIAAHLSTCGNCRTRLEQSHELRDRAAGILAFAAPAVMAAPSFEALQAQAATSTRAPRRAIPLAWAATVILALGIGWFGRDAMRSGVRTDMVAQREMPPVSTEVKEEAAPAAAAPSEVPMAGNRRAQTQTQPQSTRVPERARDMAANRVAEGQATGAAADAAPMPQVAAAPPAAPPPPSAAAPVSETAQRVELAQIAVTGVATEYMTAAEADRRGVQLARIPELPIARVGLQGTTTIVEQVLPDETLITITVTSPEVGEGRRFESASASKLREASSGAARTPERQRAPAEVVVKVGSKSVTLRADLQPDSLRALGRKIR